MQYADEIAALIGAAYVIARVIVTLTPTPKDDALFKTWSGRILLIAKVVFGLDPKQGLQKRGPK